MFRPLTRLFVDHPREVGESYLHHAVAASRFGFRLAGLSGAAFVHALVPGLHRTTVSTEIKAMADDLGYRAEVARETRMAEAGAFDPGL
ncbi:hypothetical protein HZ989_03245 [Brevundimonas sp. AJA228-03]|uniref:DUF6356 family protein n=1 Tax=Brevundimonas sp. AJA228-03 TaxID=2752515 RepID=UPI001AE00C7B|nr:DUF6356 family protein [Brevundimonas sp. AJA228-03]QTN20110.1 hypothetical protein HZ989_03245 [Brevundimonas sp. AJA228-03]